MRPASGVSKPAIRRSSVDFPPPLGPKTAVVPSSRSSSAISKSKPGNVTRACTESDLSDTDRVAPVDGIDEEQHQIREYEQDRGMSVSLRIAQRFYVVVNRDRNDLGAFRNVAADHEHDAELADRMRERQHAGGQEAAGRQRCGHGPE